MRGLPFEAGPAEIIRFFDGKYEFSFLCTGICSSCSRSIFHPCFSELLVAEKGILICKDSNRRPSGEGYCVFADEESAKEALKRDNASMGHRWASNWG